MFSKLLLKIFLALVVLTLVGCYGVRCVVFARLEAKLPELLQELEQRNISAKVQSIQTSWYDNRIVLKGVTLSNQEPNSLPMSIADASISSLTITGVQLLPLLINKHIKIDSVLIEKIKVSKYKTAKTGKSQAKERELTLSYIRIDSLELVSLDSTDKVVSNMKLSFETSGINAKFPLTDFYADDVVISGLRVVLPGSNYLIQFNEARLENMNHLVVDSLKVIPLYSKSEFVHRAGFETDRFHCVVPSMDVKGINYESFLHDNTLAIHEVALTFSLSAYRDKRIKDRKTFKALPDSLLRKLPFAVLIDSISVTDSEVVYEEVAESADSSGRIQFRKLNAMFYDISNRDSKKSMELRANAKFMNDGEISIHAKFSNSNKAHFIEGSLKNFKLAKINQMLKPATGIQVESGKLDLMEFAFWYTNVQSSGELSLSYRDLKLLSLRQNKDEKAVPNVMKTLLINAFIENDLDKNDPSAKHRGEINFVRDQNKFIFNYWWKSLLSGIKSATLPTPKRESATAKRGNKKGESS